MMPKKTMANGSTEMLVLALLSEKDRYGYEIIAELKSRSDNVFDMKSGTLYPVLHLLMQKGCLTSYEQAAGGKTRVFYRLTPDGRKLLDEKKAEWNAYSSAIGRILAGRA